MSATKASPFDGAQWRHLTGHAPAADSHGSIGMGWHTVRLTLVLGKPEASPSLTKVRRLLLTCLFMGR